MVGKTLSYHLKRGKFSFIGKPLYNTLIMAELLYVRWKDGTKAFEKTTLVDEKLTAVIKTFERPETLKRLVDSMKRLYPDMKIIIVDDSRTPLQLEGVQTIIMPYNSGISAGRNRALLEIKTKYVLFLDDDFIFYSQTNFEQAIEIMDKNEEIDIMGGEVINLPSFKSNDYSNVRLHPTKAAGILTSGSLIDGLPVHHKVPNFFIARPKRLQLVGWDERLKKIEHADFFTQAKGILLTVFNKNFKVLHAQTPFNESYMKIRDDVKKEKKVLYGKYYRERY